MLTFASTLLVWLEFGAGDAAWYHTLPDERFEGVPSIVLRLEKNYPAIKKSLLKLIGKTGHSKRNVNEARSQRVLYFLQFLTMYTYKLDVAKHLD